MRLIYVLASQFVRFSIRSTVFLPVNTIENTDLCLIPCINEPEFDKDENVLARYKKPVRPEHSMFMC